MSNNINAEIHEICKNFRPINSIKADGNSNVEKKDYDEAIKCYKRAEELITQSIDKLIKDYGKLMQTNDDLKSLLHGFQKEEININSNLALCYTRKENYEVAIKHDLKVYLY
jgi:tetratricopeptide (TPR) repeat protein